jgi:ABC-2 type transport system ATP-binding protein
VRVVSPQAAQLAGFLRSNGAGVEDLNGDLVVTAMEAPQIGEIAAANGIVLHELSPQRASLEAAFIELTRDSVEYHAGGGDSVAASAEGSR